MLAAYAYSKCWLNAVFAIAHLDWWCGKGIRDCIPTRTLLNAAVEHRPRLFHIKPTLLNIVLDCRDQQTLKS